MLMSHLSAAVLEALHLVGDRLAGAYRINDCLSELVGVDPPRTPGTEDLGGPVRARMQGGVLVQRHCDARLLPEDDVDRSTKRPSLGSVHLDDPRHDAKSAAQGDLVQPF